MIDFRPKTSEKWLRNLELVKLLNKRPSSETRSFNIKSSSNRFKKTSTVSKLTTSCNKSNEDFKQIELQSEKISLNCREICTVNNCREIRKKRCKKCMINHSLIYKIRNLINKSYRGSSISSS